MTYPVRDSWGRTISPDDSVTLTFSIDPSVEARASAVERVGFVRHGIFHRCALRRGGGIGRGEDVGGDGDAGGIGGRRYMVE